jgi:hypothetical protein
LDFIGRFGGNYYLAVELVNLMGVEEWAYSNGVAVMTLTSGVVAFLDTRSRELYLAKEYSLQRYPLLSSKSVEFRAVVFASRTIELRGPKGLKAEIVRGFLEGPSMKSEKESIRGFWHVLEGQAQVQGRENAGRGTPRGPERGLGGLEPLGLSASLKL